MSECSEVCNLEEFDEKSITVSSELTGGPIVNHHLEQTPSSISLDVCSLIGIYKNKRLVGSFGIRDVRDDYIPPTLQ